MAKPLILTTNPVIKFITSEITASKAEIEIISMLPDEKMELKSSDIFKINAAEAMVFLSDSIETGIKNFKFKNVIELSALLPDSLYLKNDFGNVYDLYIDSLTYEITDSIAIDSLKKIYYGNRTNNNYFFLDPLIVSELASALLENLSSIFPEQKAFFADNTERFKKRLILLDKQINQQLANIKGMPVYAQDTFLQYYLNRYNLQNTASLKSPSEFGSDYYKFIRNDMKKIGSNVLFVHSNFDNQIFENVNIKIIDVFASNSKHKTYADYLLHITAEIKNSLMFY